MEYFERIREGRSPEDIKAQLDRFRFLQKFMNPEAGSFCKIPIFQKEIDQFQKQKIQLQFEDIEHALQPAITKSSAENSFLINTSATNLDMKELKLSQYNLQEEAINDLKLFKIRFIPTIPTSQKQTMRCIIGFSPEHGNIVYLHAYNKNSKQKDLNAGKVITAVKDYIDLFSGIKEEYFHLANQVPALLKELQKIESQKHTKKNEVLIQESRNLLETVPEKFSQELHALISSYTQSKNTKESVENISEKDTYIEIIEQYRNEVDRLAMQILNLEEKNLSLGKQLGKAGEKIKTQKNILRDKTRIAQKEIELLRKEVLQITDSVKEANAKEQEKLTDEITVQRSLMKLYLSELTQSLLPLTSKEKVIEKLCSIMQMNPPRFSASMYLEKLDTWAKRYLWKLEKKANRRKK